MIAIYIILLIIAVLFYILYEGVISFLIFVFVLVLPPLMLVLLLISRRKLSVQMTLDSKRCGVNENIPLKMRVDNGSFLPVLNCEITLEFKLGSGAPEKVKINTPVFPNNSQTLSAAFSSAHVGIVSCHIAKVRIFDFLRISRLKLPAKSISQTVETIMIMPEKAELTNIIRDYSELGLDSENFSSVKPGDDPSEIFSIHEYSDGDKLSKIHWKLTAKQDKLMVKDYSLPLADSFLIIADSYSPDGSAELYDTVIKLTSSISYLLEQNNIRHRISAYDEKNQSIEEESVCDEQTHILACSKLLLAGACSKPCLAAAEILSDEESFQRFGHLILVTAEFTDETAALMTSCGKAYRYTVLLCSNDGSKTAQPNADIDIISVSCTAPEQSISEMIL